MRRMSVTAKLFIATVALAGITTLASGLLQWHCDSVGRFLAFAAVSAVAARLKVKLPGTNGNMSVNLPFILMAVTELSFGEAVVVAAVSGLVQSLPGKAKSLQAVQALFNSCTLLLALAAAELAHQRALAGSTITAKSLLVLLAGAAFFLADTFPVAAVIALTEMIEIRKVINEIFTLTLPYFGLSAGIAAVGVTATPYTGWQTPLLVLPLMAGTYHSYKRYFQQPTLRVASFPVPGVASARHQEADVRF